MEFTLYIGSKKVKHAMGYILSKYACTRLSRTKGRYNLDKTLSKPRREHTKVWHKKVVQIISKSKSTHDWGKIKSTYDWFQNTSTHEVWYQ